MLRKKGWLEMTKNNKTKEYSFVIDKNGEKITVNKKNNYHRNEEILY